MAGPAPKDQFTRFKKHFSSLEACVQFVRQHYSPDTTVELATGKDIISGDRIPAVEAPAFLYRGESYRYPTSPSSLDRLVADERMPLEIRTFLEQTTIAIDRELQDFMGLGQMHSAGFLQHYGAPTRLLDVTTSLEVAAHFAAGAVAGTNGLMYVLPLDVVSQKCIPIDLRDHPGAERPRRQSALALFNTHFNDLKSVDCIHALRAEWFSFELLPSDIKRFRAPDALLDAHTDKVAGVLQLIIDSLPKMPDLAAKWLSERIAPAPFTTKVIDWYAPGEPMTIELVPVSETSFSYDEREQKHKNYNKWSTLATETRGFKLIEKLGELLRSIFPNTQVLSRLQPGWPAGKDLNHLIPAHRLAFLFGPDDSASDTSGTQWCAQNGYRLIRIATSQPMTEESIRSLI